MLSKRPTNSNTNSESIQSNEKSVDFHSKGLCSVSQILSLCEASDTWKTFVKWMTLLYVIVSEVCNMFGYDTIGW